MISIQIRRGDKRTPRWRPDAPSFGESPISSSQEDINFRSSPRGEIRPPIGIKIGNRQRYRKTFCGQARLWTEGAIPFAEQDRNVRGLGIAYCEINLFIGIEITLGERAARAADRKSSLGAERAVASPHQYPDLRRVILAHRRVEIPIRIEISEDDIHRAVGDCDHQGRCELA